MAHYLFVYFIPCFSSALLVDRSVYGPYIYAYINSYVYMKILYYANFFFYYVLKLRASSLVCFMFVCLVSYSVLR